MSAFQVCGKYAIYVFMMFIVVESHQQFAKQMTIASLITFVYISVNLKLPQESPGVENIVIETVKKIPFLKNMTYFELQYLISNVLYPGIFHMALHISRAVDMPPEIALKACLLDT